MLARPFPRSRRNWDLCSFKPRSAIEMPIPQTLYNIFSLIIAATCAFALSPLCCRLAVKIGALDVPKDGRRMHTRATPRVGGLAVFFAFVASLALFFATERSLVPLLSGGLVIIAAGLLDDVYRISPWQKLFLQIAASAVAVAFGGWDVPIGMAVLWLVFLSNAFNLIDGLDGLCARVAIFSAIGLIALGGSSVIWILVGGLVGFLPFNLRPAKTFLGDTGSLFVGFALGVLSLDLVVEGEFLPLLFIFAVPFFDTVIAFLRRVLKGKSPFSPDREHFHHKLVDRGFTHGEASLLLSLAALALAAVGVAVGS